MYLSHKIILQAFLVLCAASLCSIERKIIPAPLKISVIVPCHYSHFSLLEPLFTAYKRQTSLPDEIVVSLSEADRIDSRKISDLQKGWPFAVRISTTDKKQLPGANRNSACFAAAGDVIVCQDADDLPHPQRIEAIRYLFENFEIDHLLHLWVESEGAFIPFEIQGLEDNCEKYRSYDHIRNLQIHNGSTAFVKRVFELVRWRPHLTIDEDTLFNRHTYALFRKNYVLLKPLICYRTELSSFAPKDDFDKNEELW